MAELRYSLLKEDVNLGTFDCTNASINEWIENSYYATLSQQAYAYQISYNNKVVGYYMITMRDVDIGDCPDEIADYHDGVFGQYLPSLFIEYLAVDKKYQKNKIGTITLQKIIKDVRNWVGLIPIRLITINAVQDKVEWYKKQGFLEMAKSLPGQKGYNVYMYLDCVCDRNKLIEYNEKKLEEMT